MRIPRKTFDAAIPSTAMGDIAFLLLIFFVILARAVDDSHLQWQAAESKKIDASSRSKVSVLIDVDHKLYLNGQQIGISQLAGRISNQLGDTPQGERTVLLKIHNEAPASRFEPVIEAISEAGGDLVHVLEKKRECSYHQS